MDKSENYKETSKSYIEDKEYTKAKKNYTFFDIIKDDAEIHAQMLIF